MRREPSYRPIGLEYILSVTQSGIRLSYYSSEEVPGMFQHLTDDHGRALEDATVLYNV